MPRDRALKPYRILVYLVYGIACAVLFVQLLRSVVGDLYGRRPPDVAQENPLSCLDELEHIYAELSARAVQPAPRGLESDALAREWDSWSRRWEDDIEGVSERCQLDAPSDPASQHLSQALEGIEDLRRRLESSGQDASEEARRVKEALAEARAALKAR